MADLCLRLRVFVASSSELQPEREAAEAQIRACQEEASRHSLLLEPFRWEKHTAPFHDRFQLTLNEPLRSAEHVVCLLWRKLGDGTREELQRGLAQARRGETDNVSIYFKAPPQDATVDAALRAIAPEEGAKPAPIAWDNVEPALKALRKDIRDNQLARTAKFVTTEEFAANFARNLRTWLAGWHGVAACCHYALAHSSPVPPVQPGPDRVIARRQNQFLSLLDGARSYIDEAAVEAYQQEGPEGAVHRPLSEPCLTALAPHWRKAAEPGPAPSIQSWLHRRFPAHPTPLRRAADGGVYIADFEWLWYFIAAGLGAAIQAGKWQVVSRRAYVNDVHQYLAGHFHNDQLDLLPTLRNWLTRSNGAPTNQPVVRDFAAYVLGMLGDCGAQAALFDAFCTDDSENVRRYCLTALGKLRARRYVPQLVDLCHKTGAPEFRLLLSQVICTIVGAAQFPL